MKKVFKESQKLKYSRKHNECKIEINPQIEISNMENKKSRNIKYQKIQNNFKNEKMCFKKHY